MRALDAQTAKKHLMFILWVLFAIVLDGTVLQWFSPDIWGASLMIAPHLTLVVTAWWAAYHGPYQGMAAGILVGLLKDLIYGFMLGPSAVAMGLVGLLVGGFSRLIQPGLLYFLLVAAIGDLFYQAVLLVVYRLFAPVTVAFDWVLIYRFLPTTLANVLFAMCLYPMMRRLLGLLDRMVTSEVRRD